MDINWYDVLKFLHISAAVIWVGSIVCLLVLGIRAEKTKDNEASGRILDAIIFLAPRLFTPASVAVLVLGVIMAWMTWGFAPLWIGIGILGFAATFVTGFFILRPRAEALAGVIAKEGYSNRVVAEGRTFLSTARFDTTMLFVVIADMAIKPTLDNWLILLVMVVALAIAAWRFLMPALMQRPATASA